MEMTEGYWADISRLDYSFSTRQELLEVVNKATVTDIRSAWKNLISGPKLWITLDPNRASVPRVGSSTGLMVVKHVPVGTRTIDD
jgi:hypothetical protein